MRQIAPKANTADLGTGQVYLAEGEYDKALKAVTTNLAPSGVSYYWLTAVYAAKGNRAKAIETMEKAFQYGFADFSAIEHSAYFDSIRSDPKFQDLMKKYRK